MKCPTCGTEIPENEQFCNICGTAVASFAPSAPAAPATPVRPTPVRTAPMAPAPETKLLGPWAYFGLQLLFSIPLVGFICLIVFSFDSGNIHRRNFARSYWCSLLLGLILTVVIAVLFFTFGVTTGLVEELQNLPYT